MATGDAAAAAGMDTLTGNEPANTLGVEVTKTRDYIAEHAPAVQPVAKGGTGATNASDARDNLAAVGSDEVYNGQADRSGLLVKYNDGSTVTVFDPTANGHAATKRYVDNAIAGIDIPTATQANGPTSAAYNRAATGTSWFAVYMNAQLQFMRNTSSIRYKENVRDWDGSVLGLRTVIFDRIAEEGQEAPTDEVGFIAEEVLETLPAAVMYFDGQIDGVNDRVILTALVAEVQRLAARVDELEVGRG